VETKKLEHKSERESASSIERRDAFPLNYHENIPFHAAHTQTHTQKLKDMNERAKKLLPYFRELREPKINGKFMSHKNFIFTCFSTLSTSYT